MIDAAQNYLNEDEIGDGVEYAIEHGWVTRDDLWISSKVKV